MKPKQIIFHLLLPLVSVFLSQIFSLNHQNNIQIKPSINIMILINYLLWLCLYNLCYSLFSKTYKSIFTFIFFFILFNLVNHYKTKILYQAFTISDIKLAKNLFIFLPNFIRQPKMIYYLSSIIFFLVFIFLFLKKFCHNKNQLIIRLFLLFISIFIFSIPIVFTNQYNFVIKIYDLKTYHTNPIENCKQNGILFCFYDDLKNLKITPPQNYNQSTIKQIYSDINNTDNNPKETIKPNIVLILSESLFDVTKLSTVKFSQDPIKNIRQDIKSSLISPQLGWATANIEFEILTGLSNYYYNENKVPFSQLIRQDMPSLFTLFKNQGYQTTVIHPYLRSMYNRTIVYKHLGLDKFISIEDMPRYQKAGPYVSDKSFVDEVIKQYESTDQPQLIFGLTMQNHYPFEPNRFADHPISFTDNLPEYEHKILQSYIDGISLSDKSYQILKEVIIKSDKPTIVIYFGDHLPLLLSDYDIYQLLEYVTHGPEDWDDQDDLKKQTTPIAIYSNFQTNLDVCPKMSPNFLSLEILKISNITPTHQFKFLKSLTHTDTVLSTFFTPVFSQQQLNDYSLIQHDLISGQQYSVKF